MRLKISLDLVPDRIDESAKHIGHILVHNESAKNGRKGMQWLKGMAYRSAHGVPQEWKSFEIYESKDLSRAGYFLMAFRAMKQLFGLRDQLEAELTEIKE